MTIPLLMPQAAPPSTPASSPSGPATTDGVFTGVLAHVAQEGDSGGQSSSRGGEAFDALLSIDEGGANDSSMGEHAPVAWTMATMPVVVPTPASLTVDDTPHAESTGDDVGAALVTDELGATSSRPGPVLAHAAPTEPTRAPMPAPAHEDALKVAANGTARSDTAAVDLVNDDNTPGPHPAAPTPAPQAPAASENAATAGAANAAVSTEGMRSVASAAPAVVAPAAPPTPPAPMAAPTPVHVSAPASVEGVELPLHQQVVHALGNLRTADDGHHVLMIKVHPEELGPVRVTAHIDSGSVRLELAGLTEAAREALRSQMADLRRELNATGLRAELQLSEHSGTDTPSRNGSRPSFEREDGRGSETAQTSGRPQTTPTMSRTSSGIDLFA